VLTYILGIVARKGGQRSKHLTLVRRDPRANNVAMWMVWETGRKLLREICELLGGFDYAAVAQRIRRTRSAHTTQA
jgi:hypothetical protein